MYVLRRKVRQSSTSKPWIAFFFTVALLLVTYAS